MTNQRRIVLKSLAVSTLAACGVAPVGTQVRVI